VSIEVEVRRGKGLLVIHQSSILKKRAKSGFRSLNNVWKGRSELFNVLYPLAGLREGQYYNITQKNRICVIHQNNWVKEWVFSITKVTRIAIGST